MNRLDVKVIALTVGIAFGSAATAADERSKQEFDNRTQPIATRVSAHHRTANLRTDPAKDGAAARYRIAKAQCDAYVDSAKGFCLGQARARFGKS